MKKTLTLFFSLLSVAYFAQVYPNLNINFLANIAPENTTNWYGFNTKYSGCFGWHNPADNREYAMIGSTTGVHFIEVTTPTNPVVRDYVPGAAQNSLWREIKTYQNYAYLVSDDSNSKLQIVDMSYLPDSVHLVYESDALFTRSHTIYIDGHHLYCGGVSLINGSQYSMAVFDISNPVNPAFLRALNQDFFSPGYVHDMFVRNDTVYTSGGNSGLFIFKFDTVGNTFSSLASYTSYLQAGYNHSSSLTEDGKTLVFADEVPDNRVLKILDVSSLGNLTLLDTIKSNEGATPHNPYVVGNTRAVISYYMDGVVILDISNPSNVSVCGFFDTDPAHGLNDGYAIGPVYQGCWGAYPYLPSGILLASDMQNGLFVLDASQALGIQKSDLNQYISVYPNPTQDNIGLAINSLKDDEIKVLLYDITGKLVKSFDQKLYASLNKLSFNINDVTNGCYLLRIEGTNINFHEKIVIAR